MAIEGKWQQRWEAAKAFKAPEPATDPRPKYYSLCMFPYPSGTLHMGHMRVYTIGDLISRYRRMQGFNVMQPIGWDAFGLPAENAAIQRNVHPRTWTLQNIVQMRGEFKKMGIAYDWDREVTTCLPDYFRWEQSMFRRFYEEGLAYKKSGFVNWCDSCKTVLANEQVQDGVCWRCDGPVTQKELSQWYFKITKYADQLLRDHAELEGKWPERVLDMQKHWIGESHGCRIQFKVKGGANDGKALEVFTTRADTLFGVTFVTIAAGHPMAESMCVAPGATEALTALKAELHLQKGEVTDKKGFFTGTFAIHPLTQKPVPVWVGNFVLMEYGTGAVMGVPAHDERDFEFANQYQLPVIQVVVAEGATAAPLVAAFTESGILTASENFSGLANEEAKLAIADALASAGLGEKVIQYRLRDWGISRQRYWGAPIPVIYCDACGVVLVPESDLPVELPEDVEFSATGGNPLARHPAFTSVKCPQCKGNARRETDTMDTFVESSWYYARYVSPKYDKGPFRKADADQWLTVDMYVGGVEHACMHLLYSRFFHKVLRDWGMVSGNEPFKRLLCQGMVVKDGAKMSKSKGNVVSLQAIMEKYGADTGRLFSLFAAPPEKDLDWNDKGVEGCYRFVQRVWRLFAQFQTAIAKPRGEEIKIKFGDKLSVVRRKTHWMIRKMTEDLDSDKFNVAISAAMELVNEIYGLLTEDPKAYESEAGAFTLSEAFESLTLCLAPYTPHLCEELWEGMGKKGFVANVTWPKFRPDLLAEQTFTLVVQVNGKVRDKIALPKGITKEEVEQRVKVLPKLQPYVQGKSVKQFVYVPERIANVVVE